MQVVCVSSSIFIHMLQSRGIYTTYKSDLLGGIQIYIVISNITDTNIYIIAHRVLCKDSI